MVQVNPERSPDTDIVTGNGFGTGHYGLCSLHRMDPQQRWQGGIDRFTGLISDKEIYNRILKFGLIPVGSDAWLAKGQWPVNGSIVLIHANGNEPVGVKDFINLLKKERNEALSRHRELLDLRESLIEDEEKK
ncbi:MAG: hypothetical protein NTU44_06140 [Bacteroidetes bacterium]|nr:hypothetical protein [Bacteroidota bacterium]